MWKWHNHLHWKFLKILTSKNGDLGENLEFCEVTASVTVIKRFILLLLLLLLLFLTEIDLSVGSSSSYTSTNKIGCLYYLHQ
jgi:hypothetical protein